MSALKVPLLDGGVPAPSQDRRRRASMGHLGGVRRASRRAPARPAGPHPPWQLPSAAGAARAHPERRWSHASARHPALEDKIVQQAVRMVLEPIYESEFIGFSYGFRPGRSQHDALDALAEAIGRKVNWVLDADIRSFFDTIDHGWMQKFLEHRIGDQRMVRLLMKWLHAGVMEDGELHEVEEGTPQGGIISPLLANIYLHYVLDLWVRQWRKRHARGEMYIVRYADDFVMGFQRRTGRARDARGAGRLASRSSAWSCTRTRRGCFGSGASPARTAHATGCKQPETFDFLGFTHIAGQDRTGRVPTQAPHLAEEETGEAGAAHARRCAGVGIARCQSSTLAVPACFAGTTNTTACPTNSRALRSLPRAACSRAGIGVSNGGANARGGRRAAAQPSRTRFPLPRPRIHHPWPRPRLRDAIVR